ncbi:amidohydrolase family protein [Hyphococcus lacteus]|uniref:Amidohydrolase family protein n=1 Tax=Hyphococcus lacteus TaxID=3143536 RepID=A0ABV3ZAW5_9PROT
MRYCFSAFVSSVCLFGAAVAQPLLLQNATIFTGGPEAELKTGSIVIEDETITAVGAELRVPNGARIVDLKGAIVTPGLVVANTTLGAVEVNAGANANDGSGAKSTLTSGVDLQYAINPQSSLLPVARSGGVTRAFVTPTSSGRDPSGLKFGGQSVSINTGGGLKVIDVSQLGVTLNLSDKNIGRGALFVQLKSAFADVRLYAKRASALNNGELNANDWTQADLNALVPIVRGEKPLIVSVDRASDILNIIQLSKDEKIQIILSRANEGWVVADQIAAADIPVILDPTDNLPQSFDRLASSFKNAVRLVDAGVKIAIIGPRAGHDARLLRYHAGIAVSHGLSRQAALEAITINPARIWGQENYGAIAVGQKADIAIWSGDPFEPLTDLVALYVNGEEQSLENRQSILRDKYLSAD